jgi:hypothetical protein
MKKFSIRALSLVLCLAMLVGYIVLPDVPAVLAETEVVETTTNPNLVTNGTFETVLPDGTVQVNKAGWNSVTGMASIVAEEGNANNYVAQIADNSDTSTKYIYYEVAVEPGASYTFKVDYKGAFTASGPAVYVRAGNHTSAGTTLHIKTGMPITETWTTYEVEVEIPAGETQAFILLSSSKVAVGTVQFDNVSLTKVGGTDSGDNGNEGGNQGGSDTPAVDNLIGNGTFSTQLADNTVQANTEGWTNLDGMWSVVAEEGKENNYVAKVEDDNAARGRYIYYGFAVEPGSKYTFKIDYKGAYTTGIPAIYVRLDTYNGTYLHKKTNLNFSADTWQTYQTTLEIPDGTTMAFIMIASGNDAVGTAYFDNVSVVKVVTGGNEGGGEGGGEVIPEPDYEIVIPEQNLLKNPYFELTLYQYCTPLDATTAPNGWTLETTGADVQFFKSNVVAAYDKEWSVQAVDNSTEGYFKLSYKVENIQGGVEYSYCYARTGEGKPGMFVRYYDAEDNLLQEYSNSQPGYSNWRESMKKALAPEGTSYAIISLESTAALKCNMYLDNVSFYATSDTGKTNLLSNTSFEEYPESLQDVYVSQKTEVTTKGWKLAGGDRISVIPAETEDDKAAIGNYMLKLYDMEDTAGCNAYYTMDVEPGKTYTFSALLRGEYTSGIASLRMAFYQDEACQVAAQVEGKNYASQSANCDPQFWTRSAVTATAPENAVKMRVYFISGSASVGWAYAGSAVVVEGIPNKFGNLDFEDLDETGTVAGWAPYEEGKFSASTKNPYAGKISLQVKDNSQIVHQGAISKMTDLSGYQILLGGYKQDQITLYISARVKDSKTAKAQVSILYYDSSFKEIRKDSQASDGSGKWQFVVLNTQMPPEAGYAKIILEVGDKPETTGTVYFDDVTVVAEYRQFIEDGYDWNVKYDEGNRLFFTEAELEEIRKFAKDDTINAFGISGANAYRTLIKQADGYVKETSYKAGWDAVPTNDRVTSYTVNLEHIQDISNDPLLADIGSSRKWPYLEGIASGLKKRFETVSMAYALTGDTKYSDQAISWALDMCEWEYWGEVLYCWTYPANGTLDIARITMGMATIYDMCYDQMTPEQREIISHNILHKGIMPISHDLTGPKRLAFGNKSMARCSGMLIGALAIINEDNKAEVGKYLNRAYTFAKAFLDERNGSSENEGYSYTNVALEELMIGLDCMTRVTGRESLLKHPYFEEVFIDWVCDFLTPTNYNFPVFSDSYPSGFFKSTMLMLNRTTGNGKAGYYLMKTGLDTDPISVLLYCNYDPVVTEPTENDYVVYAELVGYGGMRTGWEDGELMFYIIGNTSTATHGHFDQLSFQITTDALWPAADPGYGKEVFDKNEGHNTIMVDGVGQSVRGNGSLSQIVDSQLYGQFSGSAPDAYMDADADGKLTIPKLTQFDRHAIMINHNDRPYYIVIDEIASDTERMFDFNLNTGGWTEVTIDGKPMADGINQGNKVAIYGNNGYLFAEFVSKDKLNIEAKMYETGGPVLQADNGSGKSTQFMTILNKPYGIEQDDSSFFPPLTKTPDLVAYKTSSHNAEVTKVVNVQGNALYFFRGSKVGDWIELPFTAPESGNFELVLKFAKSYNYGTYKIYIDGEYMTTYDGYNGKVQMYNLSLGKHDIEAGEHMLKLELVGSNPLTSDNLISVSAITFATERTMPESAIYTQEVYDTDKVLGAKIFHTVNNYDIVLHNRSTGKITAGGVTTTGEQAVIIGVMEDGYMEGYTLVAGTSLVFNGKTLVKSSSAATVAADFRGKAQYAVTTEKDQSISLYAPYEIVGATVDGKSVKYSVDGNIAKVSVPAGTHTVQLKVIGAVEYLWGDEAGYGKALYDENGEMIYKYWDGEDGTEYLYEDGQLKINAYVDPLLKVLVREELLEDGSWQITTHDIMGNVNKIEIQHPNGNLTTIQHQKDGSVTTTVTDRRENILEMVMEYPDGSKTVAQYLDDKTVTTKYGTNGNVLAVTTMHNDGRRVEEVYDENGKLLSVITRLKGGSREEVIYNADGSVVTTVYTSNKLTSVKTVNADGTSVLEEHLEDGSVRVTKYDASGNVLEVTIDGKLVEEEKTDNSWIIIVIVAVAVVGVAALVIVLIKIKKRNAK